MSKYQWPASALDEKLMALLYKESRQSGIPINQLIKQAIENQLKLNKKGNSQ